jgi:beta-lactam-binding protein with PASTA domain
MQLLRDIKNFFISKHFVKHAGLVILFYLSTILMTMLYLHISTHHGEKITVPDFTGMNSKDAIVQIEKLDLEYEIRDSVYRPDLPIGTVISQNPLPTNFSHLYTKSGRTVSLRVSKNTDLTEMPNLINKQIKFAEGILTDRKLKYIIKYKATSEANGAVLEQLFRGKKINGGAKIPIGSRITLIVGQNDVGEPILTPNLVGLSYSESLDKLRSLGVPFSIYCNDCFTLEDSLAAKVIIQSPEFIPASGSIPKSTPFTITIQKNIVEEVEVPAVIEENVENQ